MLGFNKDFKPQFLRTFLKGEDLVKEALENYVKAVKTQDFPSQKESYE